MTPSHDLKVALATAAAAVVLTVLAARLRRRKPVLAIDYDEVCVGYLPAFIAFSNATYGTDLRLSDFNSYMFWEVPGAKLASREDATKRVYEFHASEYFGKIVPIPGAYEALSALRSDFELHVVTSRQHDIADKTRACVAKHYPGIFTSLHFGNHFGTSGVKVSKPDMCQRIGAVALVDDSLDYARQCSQAGIPAVLFGDYGWNRAEQPSKIVARATGWSEVASKLRELIQ